ncbi:DUF5719 family protein [Nocardioides piscis]|uniref:Uncharacterized protein n=1 Tax=Nocardioides piscis TaxID=2714938 RepID=A0A6G7YG30_9ACTN|nr:DUF5719 family protein [Nocardioides piscis]QIK75601.1 hypothetical protein G7071_09245 [Nocardioides piscis]
MTERTPGRRAARLPDQGLRRRLGARLGPVELVAIVLPILTIAALALVRPLVDPVVDRAPTDAPLVSATLVCPAALDASRTVALANADGATGEVTSRIPDEDVIEVDGTSRRGVDRSFVAQAQGDLAAGLIATRYGDAAATLCRAPQPEQWFTGVGAAPEHSSTLELVNPDGGPAVADVTVLGPTGPVEVPALRGVTVPGGETLRFDLAEVVPTRDELAVRVLVSRGRLGASVVDQVDELGRGARSRDWLPSQSEASTSAYLLGLGGRAGDRTLVVANPGADEARVDLQVVTKESEFAPADVEEIRVAPMSTETVDLTDLLGGRAAAGATGLRLVSNVPVTASLRTLADGDLSHAVAGQLVESRAALALPQGPTRLVLGGADALGAATYVVTDEEGEEVARERVELTPGTSSRVKLPADGAVVDVRMEDAGAVVALEAGPPGLSVLPLTELVLTGRIADVRPALR